MFLDFLFPRECVWCKAEGDYLCPQCRKNLKPHPEICPFCHKPSKDFKTCFVCKEKYPTLSGIIIGFAYKDFLKTLIYKIKFFHKKDGISFLNERLALIFQTNEDLQDKKEKNQIFISFVPSHRRRKYLEKGYNQSELLAKALAKTLWIPCIETTKKKRYTVSQLCFNREGRTKNLTNAFICQDLSKIPEHATILIIDDVTTTGSTLLELSKTIKAQREDVEIWGMVIARHM